MHYPRTYIGTIVSYEDRAASAIAKRAVTGDVRLTALGLEGDDQAEKKVHGGPDRALCHYPCEHYAHWRRRFPEQAERFSPPAFGENISTEGLTEENVHIGDIFRWGDALIQVTQPRSPCYTLNFHLGIGEFAALMQESGYCGWLYRTLAAGTVSNHHPLELLSRNSGISVAEAIAIAFHAPFDRERCRALLSAAGLSASWSKTMQMRLIDGGIKDFSYRLTGIRPAQPAR